MRRTNLDFIKFVENLQVDKQATFQYHIDCIDYFVKVRARVVENVALLDITQENSHGRYRDVPLVENFKTYAELEDKPIENIANAISALVDRF